ncbi:hypothetical protein PsYK624_075430 [Phanerochaete sordida]|uniref:Uncharacterized protein n=1 Tax=Phanerochaete sordida TaxID=48140 RepID=A0A9P3LED4_9APHY|nr:hypothetical protein PsYK624_075430 [Phanerochaete sordida]
MATIGMQTTPQANEVATAAATTPNTEQLREMIGVTKATMATIGQQFRTLHEQQAKIAALSPSMQDAAAQIEGMRKQIRRQDKQTQARMQEVKDLIQAQLKDQATRQLQSHIQDEIKRELRRQVREQVDLQLREHIPVTLPEQAAESKRQLVEVKHALMNSESRRQNSILRTDNLQDQLAVVLKPDGTKSGVYPHNLHSLFAYDDDMLKLLLRDHDLTAVDQREKNLNRFMAHIGVGFRLVPIPSAPGVNEAENESVSFRDNMT